ncbi:hypothetical protein [Nonlabens sp.]|uniref:hypothetical protein n=1 Tax=Nonlabens sp. TaxID=1888209 RepID=UPI003F69BCFD
MKTIQSIFIVLGIVTLLVSCNNEEDLTASPSAQERITANSVIADLMSKTASNDGSFDNIIDNASCLSIQLPVTVTVNGTILTINNTNGYQDIEDIIDLFDDDVDSVIISYPVTVILPDFSTVVVNDHTELAALSANCSDDNELDDDIECIDFQYPITASIFNANNDLINTITINNDNEMYQFIDDIDDYAAVTINFPITIILADGTMQTVNNIQELEDEIELAEDSCDEDDDNDFDDDDCENCTTSDLENLFADCNVWMVDGLEINDTDLEDNYDNYTFTFNNDGTITVTDNTNVFNGTWTANGTGSNIIFTINITGLPDFNNAWNLHEFERESDEAEIEFRLGDDELEFESDC